MRPVERTSGRRQKGSVRERLGEMLDLPLGLTLDLSEITLIGNREVTVLNHRGVIHYSPDRVVIGISEGQADISGENLVLEYILPQDIRIKGEVNGLKIVKQGESPKGK